MALTRSLEILKDCSIGISLDKKEDLIQCVSTSLSSKVVSANRELLSPIAVNSVLAVLDNGLKNNVDLNDIKISKKKGGTIDDTTIVPGLVLANNFPSRKAGGPIKMENAKIAVI